MNPPPDNHTAAARALITTELHRWRDIVSKRDHLIIAARAAGIGPHEIMSCTGISLTVIEHVITENARTNAGLDPVNA